MRIIKAGVLTGQGADRVFLTTNLPSSFPIYPEPRMLSFECEAGTGAAYVLTNFGIEAEVIDRSGSRRNPSTLYSAKGEME